MKRTYAVLIPHPEEAPIVKRIFHLAHTHGWGAIRIAKELHKDQELVARFGLLHASHIAKILTNPLYKGLFRFGVLATGIIDDRAVRRRNPSEEILQVPDFCEPLVSADQWDEVNAMRLARGEKLREIRAARAVPNKKQIQPLGAGLVVKYPLTGLVRCGACGASMRPSFGGAKNKKADYVIGRCKNAIYVRGNWLWQLVVAHLREYLFTPLAGGNDRAPEWLQELANEIRIELRRLSERNQGQRPLLVAEFEDTEKKLSGWKQSLGKPDLPNGVRLQLEADFEAAVKRRQQLEVELCALDHQSTLEDELLDVPGVIDRVRHLDTVLAQGNPTAINVELAKHIDQIATYPDRTVILRTNRLGIFEGLTELFGVAKKDRNPGDTETGDEQRFFARPPLRWRKTFDSLEPTGSAYPTPITALGPVALPAQWVDEQFFRQPPDLNWPLRHAKEVALKRAETRTDWTLGQLASHFGTSLTQIKRALKIARELAGAAATEGAPEDDE